MYKDINRAGKTAFIRYRYFKTVTLGPDKLDKKGNHDRIILSINEKFTPQLCWGE